MLSDSTSTRPSISILSTSQAIQNSNIPQGFEEAVKIFFPGKEKALEFHLFRHRLVYQVVDHSTTPPLKTILRRARDVWSAERRLQELEISIHVGNTNNGPRVLKYTEDYTFMLTEDYNCEIPNLDLEVDPAILLEGIRIKALAICLKKLHDCGIPTSMEAATDSFTFKRFHSRNQTIQNHYCPLPENYLDFVITVEKMETIFKEHYSKRAICHLDIDFRNIVQSDNHQSDDTQTDTDHNTQLIEFSMAGIDHPYCDLGNASMYLGFNKEQEEELFAYYHGAQINEQAKKAHAFFMALGYLSQVTWPLISAMNTQPPATSEDLKRVWAVPPPTIKFSDYNRQNPLSFQTDSELSRSRAALEQFKAKWLDYENMV